MAAAGEKRDWHAMAANEAGAALESGPAGLDPAEAARRLERYGPNRLPAAEPRWCDGRGCWRGREDDGRCGGQEPCGCRSEYPCGCAPEDAKPLERGDAPGGRAVGDSRLHAVDHILFRRGQKLKRAPSWS